MTDRDRLIELVCKGIQEFGKSTVKCSADEYIADYLLANGVIVPPCKVGDAVWYELYEQIETAVIYSCIGNLTRNGFIITDANAKNSDGLEVVFNEKCIGKTVFLTKEEAEEKLKELNSNDL